MALRQHYYNSGWLSILSTLKLLVAAEQTKSKQSPGEIKDWLQKQDAYTLHRPMRNPYTVNNVMDVWKCDLVCVKALSKFNNKYRYF